MSSALEWLNGETALQFTLTYDGRLASNGNPAAKSAIRAHFHPQLEELWRISPALQTVFRNRFYPVGGTNVATERHHSEGDVAPQKIKVKGGIATDLCAPIIVGNSAFVPLVRESLSLQCSLRILFMRKEPRGGVLAGRGDIDNRLKTLLDALSVPNADQEKSGPTEGPPNGPPMTYTLLENDRDVVCLEVDTRQLLTRPGAHDTEVRLIIDVEVRVNQSRSYNHPFLGG